MNLRQSGKAGADEKPLKIALGLLETNGRGYGIRTRADKAHITNQNIKKLRKLINVRLSDQTADFGNAFVIRAGSGFIVVENH